MKGKQNYIEQNKGFEDEDGKDDDATQEDDSIEKIINDDIFHYLLKAHEHEIEVLTHNSYYYIFGHYYVIQDIFTPPPENI